MTPDMKRLVEAAWCQMPVVDGVVISNTEPYPLCEAIVRAVLTELREPSEAMLDTVDGLLGLANDEQILSPWRSMIGHILAEPTAPR
jgi:hypothetical protein